MVSNPNGSLYSLQNRFNQVHAFQVNHKGKDKQTDHCLVKIQPSVHSLKGYNETGIG